MASTPLFPEDRDAILEQELNDYLALDTQDLTLCSGHDAQPLKGGHNDLLTGDLTGLDAETYANFPQWLPRYVKPDVPCEYCSLKQLECFMVFGSVTCNACDSLFRCCSFARITARDGHCNPPRSGDLDTLHVIEEDVCADRGGLTGIKQLRSKSGGVLPSVGPLLDDKKPAARFSKAAVRILRDWFEQNVEHPYPTEKQKLELEKASGLKYSQINTWLANTRRRSNKISRGPAKRGSSPAPFDRTPAIAVPEPALTKTWQDLNPLERWQHSPPENEPAPMEAIADAVTHVDFLRPTRPSTNRHVDHSSSGASHSVNRPASTTSRETNRESTTSNTRSNSSAQWSHGSNPSSLGSFNSFGSGLHGKRDRRRKRKARVMQIGVDGGEKRRIFQCTFCCDTFKTKYDWTRHEKSLHLSLEKWICAPLGPTIMSQDGIQTCVYCRAENPTSEHFATHNHDDCSCKDIDARTFYRKDHLRQHLRLMHHCEFLGHMESWKASADLIHSRCGLCDERFTSWAARNDHIAAHYKAGASIDEWRECRGLEPEVAAFVTNAMPPYLIGMERRTPHPFCASSPGFWKTRTTIGDMFFGDMEAYTGCNGNQLPIPQALDKATCWEFLTIALGKFVEKMASNGIPVTDEMLQIEGRRSIYGDEDDWNQTAADNQDWLDLFKKAHGLDIIPSQIGGIGAAVPEDVELYIDLGMTVPFPVQQARASALHSPNSPASSDPSQSTPLYPASCGHPTRHFRGYSSQPIPADRAAHFATWTAENPLIPSGRTTDKDSVFEPETDFFQLSREGNLMPSVSPPALQQHLHGDQSRTNSHATANQPFGLLPADGTRLPTSMDYVGTAFNADATGGGAGAGGAMDFDMVNTLDYTAMMQIMHDTSPSSASVDHSCAAIGTPGVSGAGQHFSSASPAADAAPLPSAADFDMSDFLTGEAFGGSSQQSTGGAYGSGTKHQQRGIVDFSTLMADGMFAGGSGHNEEFDFGDMLGDL